MERCADYNGIHNSRELSIREVEYIKYIISHSECANLLNSSHIVCTIGSPSENAVIYKATYNELPVAVKIPNVNSDDNIDREIEVNLILEDYRSSFLEMYYYKACWVPGKAIYSYPTKVLFMELATGDLLQILQTRISLEQLNYYITDVFNAIIKLAELSIRHNDLHIKNIFIVKRNYQDVAVMGDFGKSIQPQYLTSNMDDIYTFFSSLRKYLEELRYPQLFIDTITFYIRDILKRFRDEYEYSIGWTPIDDKNLITSLRDEWIHLVFQKVFFENVISMEEDIY